MGWWKRLWSKAEPTVVIETAEGQWPPGYVPLSRRDPERFEEIRQRILANLRPGHAISCEPECDGSDAFCKCQAIGGACWHHR